MDRQIARQNDHALDRCWRTDMYSLPTMSSSSRVSRICPRHAVHLRRTISLQSLPFTLHSRDFCSTAYCRTMRCCDAVKAHQHTAHTTPHHATPSSSAVPWKSTLSPRAASHGTTAPLLRRVASSLALPCYCCRCCTTVARRAAGMEHGA